MHSTQLASSALLSEFTIKANWEMKLYSFWITPCGWRVRLALAFKGVSYDYQSVNLFEGEHLNEEYTKLNPLNLVPVLETDDGVLADSIAILEYLEDKFPEKPLLPKDLKKRAAVRQVVNLIASNVQPLQNLRVRQLVEQKLGAYGRQSWVQHWIKRGFTALEEILKRTSGKYCVGDEVTLADIVLIPQVDNAIAFEVDLSEFPTIMKVKEELYKLPEVQDSVPEKQPDAPRES